jgi:ABC-type antimicrobial peptide transport system permease subunit
MPIQQDKARISLRDLPPFFRIVFYGMSGMIGILVTFGIAAFAGVVTQNQTLKYPLVEVALDLTLVLSIIFCAGYVFAGMRKRMIYLNKRSTRH